MAQDWKRVRVLVQEFGLTWRTFQLPQREEEQQIWVEAALLVEMVLWAELALVEVRPLQQIFELVEELEELHVRVLKEHSGGFLTSSSMQQLEGEVGVLYSSGSQSHWLEQ